MRTGLTEIVFVLDESGSMGGKQMVSDVIEGFNNFVKTQREMPDDAIFTFIKFSDYYKIVEDGTNLENVKLLTEDTYTPSYSTALLDSIGKTINLIESRRKQMEEWQKPEKTLFVVFTDGFENSSEEFVSEGMISKMVKERKDDSGWEFLFLGADIDAWGTGAGLGFSKGQSIKTSKANFKGSMDGLSHYTASYRSVVDTSNLDTNLSFTMSESELNDEINKLKK